MGKLRRRLLGWLAAGLLLLAGSALGEAAKWVSVPEVFHPGADQVITCSLPEDTTAQVVVTDADGKDVLVLQEALSAGSFLWDGSGVAPGEYTLQLRSGLISSVVAITVGEPVPNVEILYADESASSDWNARIDVSMEGTLVGTLNDGRTAFTRAVTAGEQDLQWDCTADGESLSQGTWELTLRLETGGVLSALCSVDVIIRAPQIATDVTYYTPAEMSGVSCDHGSDCFWQLNMGELDEDAVWQVLTAPITVVDAGERAQVKLRKEPSADCKEYTGEVTGSSQAVHVLERGEEWTLVQCYSTCVEGSSVAVYAKPVTGYVETSLLKERQVSQHIALVVDKLQQRLYVFVDGKLYSTLLCSTGYARKDTPFNETPAGEFVCQSWTGGFWSGNLFCNLAIRLNDGILLHEVPGIPVSSDDGETTSYDYTRCETYLGEKASHGCIRVQRRLTPESVNMKWLWDNLDRDTNAPSKVIIWDEVGRELDYPDDGCILYYNPNGGKYYHSSNRCQGVKEVYWKQLTAFTYGELDEKPYSKLTACPYCTPQLRRSEIDTVNKKNTRSY